MLNLGAIVMPEQKYSIVLRECRLLGAIDSQTVDIAIDGDKIAAVSTQISELGESEIDVGGKLALFCHSGSSIIR